MKARELRALRHKTGLTQAELATIAGFDTRTIKRWESPAGDPRDAVLELLKNRLSPNFKKPGQPSAFRFIDLFAGIGGIRRAFDGIGGQCVFTSEWNEYSQRTYRANFGEGEIAGDIVAIPAKRIPEHDVLLAGFPCQPFSIAGVSKSNSLGRPHGFDSDTQGTLFFEVERILAHHRPKAFLLENVKNLQSHDGGRTFAVIMRTLQKKLRYHVWTKVLDARSVVPQHRERVFIVGFRDDVDFDWNDVHLPSQESGPRLESILHPEDGSEPPEERYTDKKGRVLRKYVLSSHLWQYLRDYADKHRAKGNGFGFGLVGPRDVTRTLSARYFKDGSEILVKRGTGNPRRLTPRECARLMGFDTPGQRFEIPVSDTQAYKQFGNSVVVPLVEAVARAMRPHIVDEPIERQVQERQLRLDAILAS